MEAQSVQPSQIRKHYFLDQYVVIAPKRGLRPDSFAAKTAGHKLETPTSQPIEKDAAIMAVPGDDGKWTVKVIGNKFPALSPDNPKAYGKQEIVIETPEHNLEFSALPIEQILRIFTAYRDRITNLSKVKGIRYVSVFKNDGPAAGASIAHAHSQIVALPLVPPTLETEANAIDDYQAEHNTCPYCDLIVWEQDKKVRVIYEDKSIIAIAPYASSYLFEAWILPKRHVANFTELKHDELNSIATILKNLTTKLDNIKISYNFFLQNSLAGRNHHFSLRLEPRPNVWAGLELGTGIILNAVPPEYATLWYQGKVS